MKIRLASPREFAAINREWLPWFVPTATRDRGGRRVQVFTIAGKFVNQVFIGRECHAPDCGNGQTAAGLAFSPDPEQRYLYVANRSQAQIIVFNRKTLEFLD